MNKPFIFINILNSSGQTIKHMASHKSKRIFQFIKAEKNKDSVFEVCVNYGKGFTNQGQYCHKGVIKALKAFLEKG